MKRWELYLVGGLLSIAVGISLIIVACQMDSIGSWHLYGRYYYPQGIIDWAFMWPLILGILCLGIGLGVLPSVYTIYKLEKQLPS